MTDIDLMGGFESILAEAIYGGPPPPSAAVRTHLRAHGLTRAFHVIAVRDDAAAPDWTRHLPHSAPRYWPLRLHPGLLYLCCRPPAHPFQAALHKAGLVASAPQACAGHARWIPTLQRAIVELRHHELAHLEPANHARLLALTSADERQSRQLALQAIWRDDPDWQLPLQLWIKIVLFRNPRHLNDARRRVVELLAELTRDIDCNAGLAYPFRSAVDQIYRTFAFSDFPLTVAQIIRDLKPHLINPPGSLPRSLPESPTLQLVDRAIQYLDDHVDQPFRLDDLAHTLHVSPNHLARTFKRHTGKTIVQYLHALRIGQAKRRLRETNLTVLAVALESGFESVEHFHRIFRRLIGITPGQYRAHKDLGAPAARTAR